MRYILLTGLALAATATRGQQGPGWQLGLRLSQTTTPWRQRTILAQPDVSYRRPVVAGVQPVLVLQRDFAAGRLVRFSLSRQPLPVYLNAQAPRADTMYNSGGGFVTRNTLLRLEAGQRLPLGTARRTHLLGAAGLGLLLARTPSQHYEQLPDSALFPWAARSPWGPGVYSLTRRRRLGALLSLRLGLSRELRWRDVLSLEVAYHYGLTPVYSAAQQVEFRGSSGPQLLGSNVDTRASFLEIGVGYHLPSQKRGLPSYERRVSQKPGTRQPWQRLPARGLYLTTGLRVGAALARQGRSGHDQLSTVANLAPPVLSARLGYQWPSGWLAEAGPQTAWVPFFASFDPDVAPPASRGPAVQYHYLLAPQHTTELTGFPANTAWGLLGGRRWPLVPDRLYATAKAGVVLHHYTGPEAFGDVYRLMESTPTRDYSEFSFSHVVPRRWRVLGQVEGEVELRISRRTLLGLQLAYAARPVSRRGADQLLISWYYNGQEQVPVQVYSRMASVTTGLQLRRVLHL